MKRENYSFRNENKFSISKSKFKIKLMRRLIEYFDEQALKFITEKFPEIPANTKGAIFFEQETTPENEDVSA